MMSISCISDQCWSRHQVMDKAEFYVCYITEIIFSLVELFCSNTIILDKGKILGK